MFRRDVRGPKASDRPCISLDLCQSRGKKRKKKGGKSGKSKIKGEKEGKNRRREREREKSSKAEGRKLGGGVRERVSGRSF